MVSHRMNRFCCVNAVAPAGGASTPRHWGALCWCDSLADATTCVPAVCNILDMLYAMGSLVVLCSLLFGVMGGSNLDVIIGAAFSLQHVLAQTKARVVLFERP